MPTGEEFLVGIYSLRARRKTLSRWKKASLALGRLVVTVDRVLCGVYDPDKKQLL